MFNFPFACQTNPTNFIPIFILEAQSDSGTYLQSWGWYVLTLLFQCECPKVGAVLPILTSPFEDQLKGFQIVFRFRVLPHPFSDIVLEIWHDYNLMFGIIICFQFS